MSAPGPRPAQPEPTPGIEVTARDLVTNETGVRVLDGDDYCLVTSGRMYLAGEVVHQNGTRQLTIKIDKGGEG